MAEVLCTLQFPAAFPGQEKTTAPGPEAGGCVNLLKIKKDIHPEGSK
jgi:hypothetical protein